MSKQKLNYEQLLRKAIRDAKEAAPRAVEDLLRLATEAADAVEKVTEGTAVIEMVPIDEGEAAMKAYQLQLRKAGSEAPRLTWASTQRLPQATRSCAGTLDGGGKTIRKIQTKNIPA